MRKRVLFLLCFIFLIGFTVVASAGMVKDSNGAYEVAIHLEKGWNIIAGTVPEGGILESSEIKLSDIKAMWYYSPKGKEYLRVYPDLEESKLQQAGDDIVLTSAMWVYSDKAGDLKYSTLEDYPDLNQRQLFSGWNFVTVTPDMVDGFRGLCNIEEAYFWDIGSKKWLNFPYTIPREFTWDGDTVFGYGLIIKVSSDCKLGTSQNSGSQENPPSLPSSGVAQVNNIEFPEEIEGFILYSNNLDAEERCGIEGNFSYCKKEGRLEYRNKNDENEEIHIISSILTSNLEDYKGKLVELYNVSFGEVNFLEDNYETMWFYGSDRLMGAQHYLMVPREDGSKIASRKVIDMEHPVIKYFLDKYPPVEI